MESISPQSSHCRQFEVLDAAWDETAGVESLDLLLLDHFAQEFRSKHGSDPRSVPRALAKLRKQVRPPATKRTLLPLTMNPLLLLL